jgi:hexosaminidase
MQMNKFHWHLTNDEGWRLEIPGLPELTEIGSKRCHDMTEKTCLMTQLGTWARARRATRTGPQPLLNE